MPLLVRHKIKDLISRAYNQPSKAQLRAHNPSSLGTKVLKGYSYKDRDVDEMENLSPAVKYIQISEGTNDSIKKAREATSLKRLLSAERST